MMNALQQEELTDLVTLAQTGDDRAMTQLVKVWYPRIYNYVLKYFGDSDLASEAAQQTFIAVHAHLKKLKDHQKFKPWLYTIAGNICRQETRKGKRTRWQSFDQLLPRDEEDSSPAWEISKSHQLNPEKALIRSELSNTLKKCINKLSEDQKKVLIMKEYEGLKFREIAEILQVSENTVKSRLYYAFSHMKKLLEEESVTQKNISYED